jgi:hypothetical protein
LFDGLWVPPDGGPAVRDLIEVIQALDLLAVEIQGFAFAVDLEFESAFDEFRVVELGIWDETVSGVGAVYHILL